MEQIFKELKKLGYIHYSATTIEELDDLPLNSAERVSEQALAFRWFREKYNLFASIEYSTTTQTDFVITINKKEVNDARDEDYKTYEEAELACLIKLIEIIKNK